MQFASFPPLSSPPPSNASPHGTADTLAKLVEFFLNTFHFDHHRGLFVRERGGVNKKVQCNVINLPLIDNVRLMKFHLRVGEDRFHGLEDEIRALGLFGHGFEFTSGLRLEKIKRITPLETKDTLNMTTTPVCRVTTERSRICNERVEERSDEQRAVSNRTSQVSPKEAREKQSSLRFSSELTFYLCRTCGFDVR